jgi:hypothetical protein
MTIKSKIAAALAVVTLAGGLAIPTSSAQAGHGWGIGAGILGGAIVGAAVANSATAAPTTWTAIAAAAGSASMTPTASTSAP